MTRHCECNRSRRDQPGDVASTDEDAHFAGLRSYIFSQETTALLFFLSRGISAGLITGGGPTVCKDKLNILVVLCTRRSDMVYGLWLLLERDW